MLDWILALVMVIACAAGANAALRFARKKRRRASGKLPAGEAPVLQQVDIPSRVYVAVSYTHLTLPTICSV